MTPAQSLRTLDLLARAILLRTEGNPNHKPDGPGGGQFTSGGGAGHAGHGKHHAKRQRRQKKLAKFRKDLHAEVKAMRKTHADWRQETKRDHLKARADQLAEHRKDRKAHRKYEEKEHKSLDREHAGERTKLDRTREKTHAAIDAHHEKRLAEHHATKDARHAAIDKHHAKQEGRLARAEAKAKAKADDHPVMAKAAGLRERIKKRAEARHGKVDATPDRLAGEKEARKRQADADHADELESMKGRHEFDRGALKHEHRDLRKQIRQDQRDDRKSLRDDQREEREGHRDTRREERQEMHEWIHSEAKDAGFKSKKGAKGGGVARSYRGDRQADSRGARRGYMGAIQGGPQPRYVARRDATDPRPLHPSRTHKASDAESILRHCLRQLGLSREWRRGELTDAQRMEVLDRIREESRKWLRHEAEGLFRWHGRKEDVVPDARSNGRSDGITRPAGGRASDSRERGGVPGAGRPVHDAGGSFVPVGGSGSGDTGLFHPEHRGESTIGRDARTDGVVRRDLAAGTEGVSDGTGELQAIPRQDRTGGETDVNLQRSGASLGGIDPYPATTDTGERDFGHLLRALSAPLRHAVGRFFDRTRNFLREAILAGAMALGGPEPLDEHDLAEVDRQHAAQVGYLDQFRREVEHFRTPAEIEAEPGAAAPVSPMTAAQFAARAELYGNAPYAGNINMHRQKVIRSGRFDEERRVHLRPPSIDHPCATCAAESARGWVAIGSLTPLGDSECMGLGCDCVYQYRRKAA